MNKIVNVRVSYGETYLRKIVKEAGGKWNREKGIWQLAYQQVLSLGLERRMIKVPKVSNNRNINKRVPP